MWAIPLRHNHAKQPESKAGFKPALPNCSEKENKMNKNRFASVAIFLMIIGLCGGIYQFNGYLAEKYPQKQEISKAPEKSLHDISDRKVENKAQNQSSVANDRLSSPADHVKPDLKPVQQNNAVISETEKLEDFEHAVSSGDETAIYHALEAVANCSDCIGQMINILQDDSRDKTVRKYSAKALIKSGTGQGVLAVLRAVADAHYQEDYEFKGELMQIFADIHSADAADMLSDVLTGKYSDLSELPEDVTYAVKKAISLTGDDTVGENLADKYYSANEEDKEKLADINHAVANAKLAAEAYAKGNNEEADEFLERLSETEDTSAIKGIMLFAKEKTLPLDNIADIMSRWMLRNSNDRSYEIMVDYISNTDFTPEERSVAAYALANEKNVDKAVYALEKAYKYEEDASVRSYIENALSRLIQK